MLHFERLPGAYSSLRNPAPNPVPTTPPLARRAVLRCLAFLPAILQAAPYHSLHLDSQPDREAFRRWFTFLAEAEFYAPKPNPEISDCAALVRWCFRQAISTHDSVWARSLGLPVLPVIPPVQQFAWPHTPAGADVFQTGEWRSGQFADALTLARFNAHPIARRFDHALPGDLLFYRQEGRTMPGHVMIYCGRSQFEPASRERWLVYHTGPSHSANGGQSAQSKIPGEIRKVTVEELCQHPSPEWRPLPGNQNFLGISRLNILRDAA